MSATTWNFPNFVITFVSLLWTLSVFTQTQVVSGSRNDDSAINISYILNSFQVGYDRRVRPNYGGIPVTVGVSLYILSIGDLSEKDMDFTFDMYFRQFWSDPRLSFDKNAFGIEKLVVGSEYIKLIWVPDTFFVNEKIALFHQATTENQFLRITNTGEVLRSMRLTIKATCPMNLANFPFDSQRCTVEIESFGYTMADLKYKWNDGNKSVQMSPDVQLPQFLVLGHRQRFIEVSLSSGNYSRLLADVQFIRSMGYYMIQVSNLQIIRVKLVYIVYSLKTQIEMERDEIQLSDPQHTFNALFDICVEEMVILSCLAPSHSSSYFAPRFDFTLLLQRNYHSSHSKLLFPYFPNSHVIYEGLHPIKPDRYYVVGVILAEQRSSSSKSRSGSDHSPHHDNSHQLCQRCSAKDLLHEVH